MKDQMGMLARIQNARNHIDQVASDLARELGVTDLPMTPMQSELYEYMQSMGKVEIAKDSLYWKVAAGLLERGVIRPCGPFAPGRYEIARYLAIGESGTLKQVSNTMWNLYQRALAGETIELSHPQVLSTADKMVGLGLLYRTANGYMLAKGRS